MVQLKLPKPCFVSVVKLCALQGAVPTLVSFYNTRRPGRGLVLKGKLEAMTLEKMRNKVAKIYTFERVLGEMMGKANHLAIISNNLIR